VLILAPTADVVSASGHPLPTWRRRRSDYRGRCAAADQLNSGGTWTDSRQSSTREITSLTDDWWGCLHERRRNLTFLLHGYKTMARGCPYAKIEYITVPYVRIFRKKEHAYDMFRTQTWIHLET